MSEAERPANASFSPEAPGARPPRAAEPLLCEVAWEVCEQLGGIYTVIRTKAPTTKVLPAAPRPRWPCFGPPM